MEFSIKNIFSKRDQIRSFLKISKWSETLVAMQMECFYNIESNDGVL